MNPVKRAIIVSIVLLLVPRVTLYVDRPPFASACEAKINDSQ